MFTKEQIEAAHGKVKSGADFPAYVNEIKSLGVKSHEVSLKEGTWIFKGLNNHMASFVNGPLVPVSERVSVETFEHSLTIHQRGETDYLTFCQQAGKAGVDRWISDFFNMAVTYYDAAGNVVAIEPIPGQ